MVSRERIRRALRRKRVRYPLIFGIILGIFFLISSVVAITLFAVLPERAVYLLPDVGSPTASDRVLILSPHPDDETIAAGGYIQKAKNNGAEVKIILATDGDRRGLGDLRYQEFIRAAGELGVEEDNLEFWEFSDGRGLNQVDSMTKMVVADLKSYRPTIVLAPMVQDDHKDHQALGRAFLSAAKETGFSGLSYGFLVHHRYYPQPKKFNPDRYLSPPIKYLSFGQGWQKLMLSPEEIDRKNEALLGYHSQLKVPLLNSLLKSMVRKNELFIKLDY
jgi:LmbE family N-acetylglucosaminyl deacetylase